jgi:hypothetical protein
MGCGLKGWEELALPGSFGISAASRATGTANTISVVMCQELGYAREIGVIART